MARRSLFIVLTAATRTHGQSPLPAAPPVPPTPHADLPPILLRVIANGTEAAFTQGAATLSLELSGDAWVDDVETDHTARDAVLSAFQSLHTHEAAGWTAVVAPALNSTAHMVRTSGAQLSITLPRLPCYDPLAPEIVLVRMPGAAIASGRGVIAPALRISADEHIRPPRWGTVRPVPREVERNCTHVTLTLPPPYHRGGTPLAGFRLEVRRDGSSEWIASELIAPPSPNASAEGLGVVGPLEMGVGYMVRVRAYATGTGCRPLAGDDGAPIRLVGGWRADALRVAVGPAGGPVHGGTAVVLRGACMQAVRQCVWGGGGDPAAVELSGDSASGDDASGDGAEGRLATTAALGGNESEVHCTSAARLEPGTISLDLVDTTGSARSSGLSFEYFALRARFYRPAAGPVAGGVEVRVLIDTNSTEGLWPTVRLADARCRFAGVVSGTYEPVHASAFQVSCVSPHSAATGLAQLEVSIDGGTSYTAPLPAESGFLYYNATLASASPAGGPVRGGTLVTLAGSGLALGSGDGDGDGSVGGGGFDGFVCDSIPCSTSVHCHFGLGGTARVERGNATHIECVAPPTGRVAAGGPPRLAAFVDVLHPDRLMGRAWDDLSFESVELSYSPNGEDYVASGVEWTYYAPPGVSSIAPADGPASGGHAVTVRGDGFVALGSGAPLVARCRFGSQVTRVLAIRSSTLLTCEAPSDVAARDAALLAPLPAHVAHRPASGIGDDATFALAHAGGHCCAAGAFAARVGSSEQESLSACQAACLLEPSCRHLSYSASATRCDLCSSCVDAPAAAAGSNHTSAGDSASVASFESYHRLEPPLPALLPFALSLNGQQYELSDAYHNFELGYLMYAATAYDVRSRAASLRLPAWLPLRLPRLRLHSTGHPTQTPPRRSLRAPWCPVASSLLDRRLDARRPSPQVSAIGGPRAGGTLVTVTGRGFARAAARAAAAPMRFGTLWWERHAILAPRCRFGEHGSTTPIQLRDDELVCLTPPLAAGAVPDGGQLTVPLSIALNAGVSAWRPPRAPDHALYGIAPHPAPEDTPYDYAHFEASPPLTLVFYDQLLSSIYPPGGPTAGGTLVLARGLGLHSLAPHPAVCSFGQLPSNATFGNATDEALAYGALPLDGAALAADAQEAFLPAVGDAGGGDAGSGDAGDSGAGSGEYGSGADFSWRSPPPPPPDMATRHPVLCTAPAHADEGVVRFRLALNHEPRPCEPSRGLVRPAYAPASAFDAFESTECADGFRGSFRPLDGVAYDYYAPPVISAIHPTRGLHTGGVAITVTGHGFRALRHDETADGAAATVPILCGFGPTGATPSPGPNQTSVATLDGSGRLRCLSPWREAVGMMSPMTVALNGLDFEGGGESGQFAHIAPLRPWASFPRGGTTAGGAVVHVLASGLLNATDDALRCRFGDQEVAASLVPLARLAVEGRLVRGVHAAAVDAGQPAVLRCTAPSAHESGATALLVREFNEPDGPPLPATDVLSSSPPLPRHTAMGDQLLGDAIVDRRTLRLTRGRSGRTRIGSLVLARDLMAPAAIVRHFEASLELFIYGGTRGHGLSFSYGPTGDVSDAAPVGEGGIGHGLTIRLLTGSEVEAPQPHLLEVTYDGELLETVYAADELRTSTWANMTLRYDGDGLSVVHNGVRRVTHLPVFGYSPTAAWQFVVGARAGPSGDEHRLGHVRLRSGDLLREGTVPLAVSVNGQDFSSVEGGFRYYTPPVASAASPASGPADGGTLVHINGFGFGSATQLECAFDGEVVRATLVNATAARCTTPVGGRLNVSAPPLQTIPVRLSMNGGWSDADGVAALPWLLRSPPAVSGFTPASGPLTGGTSVTLRGHALLSGTDMLCRFAGANRSVAATYDALAGTLHCTAPPAAVVPGGTAAAAVGALEVSANGQQYTSSGVAFSQFPSLAVLGVAPARGAALGGTLVRVDFDARGQPLPFEALRCQFGDGNATQPLEHAPGWALCRAPPAYEVKPTAFAHSLTFTDANATDGSVRLDTLADARVHDGVLRLTGDRSTYLSDGEQVRSGAAGIGSAIVTLRRPYNALHWFELRFEAWMGSVRHLGGWGLSVCLGDLSEGEPFGEAGAGHGLRVVFRTRHPNGHDTGVVDREAIEVWYAQEQLYAVGVGNWLRTSSWVPVLIRYDVDGLHVHHNGRRWIERYKVRGWAPRPSWRFGFGARGVPSDNAVPATVDGYGNEVEAHMVDNVHLSSGLLIAEARAGVTLAFNGQQYAPVPTAFSYYAMPSVSAVTPTTGPLAGGTRVTVSGSKLDAGEEVTDSVRLGYRCRLGDEPRLEGPNATCEPFGARHAHADADCYYSGLVVNATYGGEFALRTYGAATASGSVSCVTPPRAEPRTVALELSLNAQQYTADERWYGFYTEAVLSSLTPLSGPQDGGTQMVVLAAPLGNGSDHRCRFFEGHGDRGVVPATFDGTAGVARCVSPPLPDALHANYSGGPDNATGYPAAHAARLHLTKNGQNYDLTGLPFAYFRRPVRILHDPPGGPLEGNTTVTIFGAFAGGVTADYVCRFGERLVPATHRLEPTELMICISPNGTNMTHGASNATHARPVPLHVSLNGQQFHPLGTYHYYDQLLFSSIAPVAGPTRGGTQLVVNAVGLVANTQPGLDGNHQCARERPNRPPRALGLHLPLAGARPPAPPPSFECPPHAPRLPLQTTAGLGPAVRWRPRTWRSGRCGATRRRTAPPSPPRRSCGSPSPSTTRTTPPPTSSTTTSSRRSARSTRPPAPSAAARSSRCSAAAASRCSSARSTSPRTSAESATSASMRSGSPTRPTASCASRRSST